MKLKYMMASVGAMLATGALAQTEMAAAPVEAVPAAAPMAAMPAAQQLVLPPNTEITVTPVEEANSKKLREGDKFQIKTVFDVMSNGYVVIPKGTMGSAEVTWRTGKGAFGKSAKMEISFRSLDIGGQTLQLAGTHRQEGQGNTGAAVGAAIAVGVFGAFVTGKSAIMPAGMHLNTRTAEALNFRIPAGAVAVPTAEVVAPAAADTSVAATPTT
jgi:hypothetical protein